MNDVGIRVRFALAAGAMAYALRAWNLWGNSRATVLFDDPKWLWPSAYAIGAVVCGIAAVRLRLGDIGNATLAVVVLSAMRGYAVVASPTGGWESLHVGANFAFVAVVVAVSWPFMLRGRQLDDAKELANQKVPAHADAQYLAKRLHDIRKVLQ